jgi:hypothetical protein
VTDQLYVPSTMPRPFRAMVMGSLQPGYYTSADDERRDAILPAMKALLDSWEALGARLIGSFDDDLFVAGPPQSADFSIYLLYELDELDPLIEMLQLVRERRNGVRLDEYIRFEARVGRGLFLASDFPRDPEGAR